MDRAFSWVASLPAPARLSLGRRLATLVATYATVSAIYAVIGARMAEGDLRTVESALDRAVPFSPPWVLVYALVFLQAAAPAVTISDGRVLQRTVLGYLFMYAVAVPVWLLFPVTVPRAPIPITDVWTYGVALTRFIDPPSNCLPSMHVALAVYAALVVRRHDRAAGAALIATAAIIWYSTMAVGQHWAADGLAAAILALVADRALFGRRPLPDEAFQPLSRWWHLLWIGGWAVGSVVLMSGWWLGWMPVARLQAP